MGKYLGIVAGSVATFFGLILLISWWYEFSLILKGLLPAILILGGTVGIFAGISELKDTLKNKKDSPS